jgi:hypothetical protein
MALLTQKPDYEPGGRGFKSCRARQSIKGLHRSMRPRYFACRTSHLIAISGETGLVLPSAWFVLKRGIALAATVSALIAIFGVLVPS